MSRIPKLPRVGSDDAGPPEGAQPEQSQTETPAAGSSVRRVRLAPSAATKKADAPTAVTDEEDSTDGAGAQEPSEPRASVTDMSTRRRPRWGRRLSLIALVCLLLSGLAVVAANVTPWLRVDTIEVTGNKFVTLEAINGVMKDAQGKNLPQVDSRGLEARLGEIPGVARARVSANPPHGLKVAVVERAPVAQVQRSSGVQLIDSEGKVITTVKDAGAYRLPVISPTTAAKPAVFQAVTTALSSIPSSILGDMKEARATSPDSVELLMNSGLVIVWGNDENAAQKSATLSAMLKALAKPTSDPTTGAVPQPVQTVDVSVPGSPVTK